MALKGQEKPNLAGFCHMSQQPTLQEKTQRAFRAYATLVDTADWLKTELRGPLELFDLTVREFRLMEVLYRDGALPIADVAFRRKMGRSNLHKMIRTLSRRGWVRQAMVTLPPVEFKRAHLPEARRNEPRKGRRIAVVGLTKPGKKYMKDVLPRHSKLVQALMRVLDAREQESLVRICEKLRKGDVLKFLQEIRMKEPEI